MSDPTVCAVMITRDRPEFARRAVACFRAQSYDPIKRMLLILDSGDPAWYDRRCDSENEVHLGAAQHALKSIGALRNIANATVQADIIFHWDSDDWSHPNRIAEQVSLLQTSGAECVGYRDCLFWRAMPMPIRDQIINDPEAHPEIVAGVRAWPQEGEAWLYSVPNRAWAIGSSFCYWRSTWERHPFPDLPRPGVENGSSEDVVWRRGVKCVGVTSLEQSVHVYYGNGGIPIAETGIVEPRMICRIHGGNTTAYDPAGHVKQEIAKGTPSKNLTWRRVPEWDAHCWEVCG